MSTSLTNQPDSSLPIDPRARLSVLVVEDEPSVRAVLTRLLEKLGLDVSACCDGKEAWATLEKHPRDMLITDWEIPGISGPDLVRQIRLSEHFPGLYIIMVTGRIDSPDRVEGLEAGADDFVGKPFDPAELRVRVRAGQRIVSLQKRLLDQNRALSSSNTAMSRELRAADSLQRALIPAGPARIPGFDCAWAFHPYSQGSGDMFGVFPLDERHVGAFLVDVCGHGMASAMLSFTVSRLLTPVPGQHTLVKRPLTKPPYYEIASPAEVLTGLREWFKHDESSGFYFTIVYAVLNGSSGELQWVSGGHPPPILLRSDGCQVFGGQAAQTPIGLPIAPQGDASVNCVSLAPGERVFFYSDGVMDLRDLAGVWLPENTLQEALDQASRFPIGDCVQATIERLKQRTGRPSFDDDATLVGLERRQRQ